jgi:hypothetical protein
VGTITQRPAFAADKFDRVWASLPSADRLMLLGHDRPDLTPADKAKLAAVAQKLRRSMRRSWRRTGAHCQS